MFKNILFLSGFIMLSCTNTKELKSTELIKGKKRSDYEAVGKKYMISSQGAYTSKAASYALEIGGNIFDAATAASFTISVERPHSTGIGGGGFMLINHAKTKEYEAYDFRETAPGLADKKMFLDEKGEAIKDKSLTGVFAVGTPGLVAGILEIHKKYGKLPLEKLMRPAILLAREGMVIYPELEKAIEASAKRLCKFDSSKKIFLEDDCSGKKVGTLLKQKDLANTLELIAKNGVDGFYKGPVADKIVASQKANNGLITHSDLKNYKVKKRIPIVGSFRGNKIVSMPPPSSGGTHVVQILNILENFNLKGYGAGSAEAIHLTSTAMQIAFADRAEYMGDSDFASIPIKELTSKKYAKLLSSKVKFGKALKSKNFPVPFTQMQFESDHTTHFSIMDSQGNVVSSTQTINGWFGSAMVAEGTGIVMNNEMDDFAAKVGGINLFGAVGGKNNLVEPFKRPLSSMSPTIVFGKSDKPILTLGTPSGTRILTCVMQTILNYLEHDMSLWDSVSAMRYHHQWNPEEIRIGSPGVSPKVAKALTEMGHKLNRKDLGCRIQAIEAKNGVLHGVSDPRGEGMSLGR